MNYAAVLAVVLLFTFSFPVLARVASSVGLARSVLFVVVILVLLMVAYVRWVQSRVDRYREHQQTIALLKENIAREPHDPSAYYAQGKHLVEWLSEAGKRREADRVLETFTQQTGVSPEEAQRIARRLSVKHQRGTV